MLKIEYIWRDLLDRIIDHKNPYFTQTELAKRYGLSTSVVSHALMPLRDLNIINIKKTSSMLTDWERLLFFWATRRNLKKDIIYSTFANIPQYEREGLMPPDVIPAAYSAFRIRFGRIPSDYEHVYFYAKDSEKVEERFPQKKSPPNIFILKADPYLVKKKKVGIVQLFVDLWNLPDWYAKDFQNAVLLEIKKRLKNE